VQSGELERVALIGFGVIATRAAQLSLPHLPDPNMTAAAAVVCALRPGPQRRYWPAV